MSRPQTIVFPPKERRTIRAFLAAATITGLSILALTVLVNHALHQGRIAALVMPEDIETALIDGPNIHVTIDENIISGLCGDARMVRKLVRYKGDKISGTNADIAEEFTLPTSFLNARRPGRIRRTVLYMLPHQLPGHYHWSIVATFIPGCGVLGAFNVEDSTSSVAHPAEYASPTQ